MTFLLWAIVGLLALLILLVLAVLFSRRQSDDRQPLLLLQNQLVDLRQTVTNHLQHQATATGQLLKEVTVELTKVGEATKKIGNLEDILKNPKQRGILGEYYLETLLKNIFAPGQYQLQYAFKDGSVVDAVIFVKDKIIPIDSKFSLENYQRAAQGQPMEDKTVIQDLKNRINETAKYIKPAEETMDFAFMFIPAEAIYYDLLVDRDLIEYAWSKRVIVVSPTSFYAYLQTIMQGMRALQIEESAKEIVKRVGELSRHLAAYEDHFKRVGVHLGTTVNAYNTAYKELGKIDKDVLRITGQAAGIEPELLEKPQQDEEGILN